MVHSGFGVVPHGIPGTPVPFNFHIPQADIHQLTSLVKNGVIAAPSFYTTHNFTDGPEYAFGASRDWLADAAKAWVDPKYFDWRAMEKHWNSFPQFTINVTGPSDGQVFDLHFGALFSRKPDAIPIIFSHGWPSSWLDFIPMLELLTTKYTPETLPYHIITPSIPDYGLSTRSNLTTTELNFYTAAEALNELMKALGFDAYVAQGGDVGSALTATLGAKHDECKAVLFNNFILTPSEIASVADLPVTPGENASIAAGTAFRYSGVGYMLEQGTKPGAIALVSESNPLAMLGWIGSLYAEGTPLPLTDILKQVSWYWYTKSYGRGLWAYRAAWASVIRDDDADKNPTPLAITNKPLGYSRYPFEVLVAAKSWLDHWFPDNLVFYREHPEGGHFAAAEQPVAFLQDIEDFVAVVKAKAQF
ncbi:Alpha/Beta hydrolase protein [Apodospora peruviana]|uniref:Alpha/Beta hydrolase protein n=1 Tax=Apodospora peruviana TaxID=516989 RepID=A0AAE0IIX3_9PEZI|nr:Alpha/Beta hydrolase protein [Apodospora peruviana]